MQNILDNGFYTLKDNIWLENQRYAGKVLKEAFHIMEQNLIPGISTKKLNDIAEEFIISHTNCFPTFKGYSGFPESICISINKEVVHGIPKENVIIKEGDIVKLDGGVTYNGAIADMAKTYAIGDIDVKQKYLIETCKKALNNAIDYIDKNIGRNTVRLGDVGNIIYKTAKNINANVITELSGHGISDNMLHTFPFVYNNGDKGKGLILHSGMTIAIEPMLLYGSNKITVMEDKWTITTNSIAAHEEHTIFIHNDHVEIITN